MITIILSYYQNGADDGNRTHVVSLEGWGSTIKLHLHQLDITNIIIRYIAMSTFFHTIMTYVIWKNNLDTNYFVSISLYGIFNSL